MVQQGAHFNLLEGNACTGSKDADGAGEFFVFSPNLGQRAVTFKPGRPNPVSTDCSISSTTPTCQSGEKSLAAKASSGIDSPGERTIR